MVSDVQEPTSNDFAALQVFASGPAEKINKAMLRIRDTLKPKYPALDWGKEEKDLGGSRYIIESGGTIS